MDEKVRLSVDLDRKDHKLLKLECSKRGLVPKLTIQCLIVEWLEDVQDIKKGKELDEICQNDRWVSYQELRRRAGWDAL